VNVPIEVSEAVIAVATERTTARSEVSMAVMPLKKKANPPNGDWLFQSFLILQPPITHGFGVGIVWEKFVKIS
jgi:hypothetical protein